MRIQRKEVFDYDAELARHMCAGCNKAHGGGQTLLGYVCTAYKFKPGMYVRANECPMNPRRRRILGRKVLVGQQKQGRVG